jgi:hypothetical protein
MSLQKKPALRRNYSDDKMLKSKDCSLPNLVKGQDHPTLSRISKRYNLEPFKLRVNNAQERRIESVPEQPIQRRL